MGKADIVVVGGGLAGYCAALAAAEAGGHVLLTEKQPTPGGSTVFRGLELSAGQSVPRSNQTDMPALIASLHAHALETGRVEVRTETRALRLEQDRRRVNGVLVEDAGGLRMQPARAVILATGGFSRSEELLAVFAPAQAAALRIGGGGSTGDGLRMGWALGAGMRDMGQIKGTFGTHPDTGRDRHAILLTYYLGAIIVNRAGRRFVDESLSYKLLGDACLQQPGRIAFQIFDEAVMCASQPGVPLFDMAPALAAGTLHRADSLAALATMCGVDPAALQQTVAEYNAGVDAGSDAFGRDGLCHHAGTRVRLDRPPFYAYPSTSAVLATYCGLAVTPQAAVLDVFGEPIPGLFAAGEVVGGFHGAAYMTGSSLGKAAFFGRVAGRSSVQV